MERIKTTAKKKKQYVHILLEPEVAMEFKDMSRSYRIMYSELMKRMLKNYRNELEKTSFRW